MKVRCICGKLMHDEDSKTCKTYSSWLDQDYYDALEKNPATVEELVDNMPLDAPFWMCSQCGRLHFFKLGKIQVFKLEQEVLD